MTTSAPEFKSTDWIRETFLSFFEEQDHRRQASAPLIPSDPTLLLNIAGMVPFKPYFLGDAEPPTKRITTAQKCVRTNDIENVGRTTRHLTFFEMLGNFSFGDYFKREAIRFAWKLSTEYFGLDPERIWATVFEEDEESVQIWLEETEIPLERIQKLGADDNYWWTHNPGPGGPCSEMYYDRGPAWGEDGGPAVNDERYLEYYNLVFMQDQLDADRNVLNPLPAQNVDTGLGIERLAVILQDVRDVFETDVFAPLLARAGELTGTTYGQDPTTDLSLRILAEHARTSTFLIADGVLPAKAGRGYVLRRLIRRVVRHARLLGTDAPVMPAMIDAVIDVMGGAYPELVKQRELVMRVATAEEADFSRVIAGGLARLDAVVEEVKAGGGTSLPGDVTFELHDTFGFPLDLTAEIAEDVGLELDRARFDELMEAQKERARAAAKKGDGGGVPVEVHREASSSVGATEFLGYQTVTSDSTLGALLTPAGLVEAASEGDEIEVVLPRTPFYAEGGGQVGDRGIITTPTGRLEVLDTQEAIEGLTVHRARVIAGEVAAGQEVEAQVDAYRRVAIARSHSATHVLHATIKQVLGEHAQQAGSLVQPGRLRFDFPHFEGVSADALAQIEGTVNERVLANPTVVTEVMGIDDAKKAGAVANFGDKYGQTVRVVTIGDWSKELCGGTHVPEGAVIGSVHVVREESIGSNTRRIEALTGIDAYRYAAKEVLVAQELSHMLGVRPHEAADRLRGLMEGLRAAEKELADVRRGALLGQAASLADVPRDGGGNAVVTAAVTGVVMDDLRALANDVRGRLGEKAVVVLGSASDDGKAQLICVVSKDLVDAGVEARPILHPAAQAVGGGAGGKGDMAQAGGKQGDRLGEALEVAARTARELLGA